MKVLFILKRRPDYNGEIHSHIGVSTGLFNSATFTSNMLADAGIDSVLEIAIDNNCIDRLVTKHKPTYVIIEALWVVPEKFDILQKLHPKVTWIIRLHSEIPFIAGEGMAMNWIGRYLDYKNIILAANAPRMLKEVKTYLDIKYGRQNNEKRIIYLPNFYPNVHTKKIFNKGKKHIDISCFGAIRPLKNQLLQAIAAVKFADSINKKLRFHINVGRLEMNGSPVFHNLKALFENLKDKGHELVTHEWTPREEFLELCATMDIGLQVSFTETFNIVGADLISQGVPLVGSNEIPWSCSFYNADPVDSDDIYRKLYATYYSSLINVTINQIGLNSYTENVREHWLWYFNENNE